MITEPYKRFSIKAIRVGEKPNNGRLTIKGPSFVAYSGNQGQKKRYVVAECDCGVIDFVELRKIVSGHSQSCGCRAADITRKRSTKHGHAPRSGHSRTFASWCDMIQRCTNPKREKYRTHGARGIKVCDRWMNSFENFLADMGERPFGTTIDRRNNDGNYEPGNCRWATPKEQGRNKRNNRFIEFAGQRLCLSEWAEISGVTPQTIAYRLKTKQPIEKVLAEFIASAVVY